MDFQKADVDGQRKGLLFFDLEGKKAKELLDEERRK